MTHIHLIKCMLTKSCNGELAYTGKMKGKKHVLKCTACGKTALD